MRERSACVVLLLLPVIIWFPAFLHPLFHFSLFSLNILLLSIFILFWLFSFGLVLSAGGHLVCGEVRRPVIIQNTSHFSTSFLLLHLLLHFWWQWSLRVWKTPSLLLLWGQRWRQASSCPCCVMWPYIKQFSGGFLKTSSYINVLKRLTLLLLLFIATSNFIWIKNRKLFSKRENLKLLKEIKREWKKILITAPPCESLF